MSFFVVEIDNDIGSLTVKDEGSGVTSLDVNVRSPRPLPTSISEEGSNLDAFGRLRISGTESLFDSKQIVSRQDLYWTYSTSGGGSLTHDSDRSSSFLSVGTASGDKVVLQTKEYFNYLPGKGSLIKSSFVLHESKTGLRQRAGYFDDDNGLFIEQNGSDLKVVRRTKTSGSVVDNFVLQANWNQDKLDGTGNSGYTLDLTKVQIFIIDYEWPGRIRFGFNIQGQLIYVHDINTANILDVAYMTTPNLPIRFEIENTGVPASSSALEMISCSVVSESGYSPRGIVRSVDTHISAKSVNTTTTALVSIRLKEAHKRAQLIPISFAALLLSSNDNTHVELILNPTLGGTPSWISAGANSIAEYDLSATTVTGGEIIQGAYISSQGNYSAVSPTDLTQNSFLKVLADIAGNRDVLTLAATNVAGLADVLGSLAFQEVF